MKAMTAALLLPLIPLAVQAGAPVWITIGADSGVELKQVNAKFSPPVQCQRGAHPAGPD